jgi:hypothetical protein
LVGLITGSAATKSGKKKSAAKMVMQRPIICICNDLYAPALRNLRQNALLVIFLLLKNYVLVFFCFIKIISRYFFAIF